MGKKNVCAALFASLVILSACTGTESTLNIEKAANGTKAPPPPFVTLPNANGVVTIGRPIRFAPIVGSNVEALTPLMKQISLRASEQGVKIVPLTDNSSYLIKGFLSAVSEPDNTTTVIYVWDINDNTGNRLHRIQGTQSATGSSPGSPWQTITPQTMKQIGDKTIVEIRQWLAQNAQ